MVWRFFKSGGGGNGGGYLSEPSFIWESLEESLIRLARGVFLWLSIVAAFVMASFGEGVLGAFTSFTWVFDDTDSKLCLFPKGDGDGEYLSRVFDNDNRGEFLKFGFDWSLIISSSSLSFALEWWLHEAAWILRFVESAGDWDIGPLENNENSWEGSGMLRRVEKSLLKLLWLIILDLLLEKEPDNEGNSFSGVEIDFCGEKLLFPLDVVVAILGLCLREPCVPMDSFLWTECRKGSSPKEKCVFFPALKASLRRFAWLEIWKDPPRWFWRSWCDKREAFWPIDVRKSSSSKPIRTVCEDF